MFAVNIKHNQTETQVTIKCVASRYNIIKIIQNPLRPCIILILMCAALRWRWCSQTAPAGLGGSSRKTCNEALADLTNSSLIQNSAHRQFDIISRSRTLAVTSHHPASCSSRLQSALILSDFYKYVISTIPIFSVVEVVEVVGGTRAH